MSSSADVSGISDRPHPRLQRPARTSGGAFPTCASCVDELTTFESGLLPEGDREVVSEHLTTCPECRLFVDQVDQTRRLLAATPTHEPTVDVDRLLTEAFAESSAPTDARDLVTRLHRLATNLRLDDPDDLVQQTLLSGLERGPGRLDFPELARRLVSSATGGRRAGVSTTASGTEADRDLLDSDSDTAELYFPDFYEDGPDLGKYVDAPNVWGRANALQPDEDYATGELYDVADRAMDALPARTRQLVQLVDVEGFSLAQAAAGVDLDERMAAREINLGRIHVRGALDAYLTGR